MCGGLKSTHKLKKQPFPATCANQPPQIQDQHRFTRGNSPKSHGNVFMQI
jgi:hypothetical protein